MAKSGRQLSRSAASTGTYVRCAKCVLTAATRCPPAEKPITPTLCGSTCHCTACWRTSPNVRCASCSAVCTFGYTRRWCSSSHHGPEPGTRYFSSTQVTPRDVSQSQICVPSKSMANTRYPPPGNTTTAAPVLRSLASYTVIVGRLTSLTLDQLCGPLPGPTDSGFESGIASGTAPGQIGTCTWPGDGCQPSACTTE